MYSLTLCGNGIKISFPQFLGCLSSSFLINHLLPVHCFGKYCTLCVQIVWAVEWCRLVRGTMESRFVYFWLWSGQCIELSFTSTAVIHIYFWGMLIPFQHNISCFAVNLNDAPTMMTSSNGNIFRVTGPLCGEFTGPGEFPTQRPVTRSFDVYFDLRPN